MPSATSFHFETFVIPLILRSNAVSEGPNAANFAPNKARSFSPIILANQPPSLGIFLAISIRVSAPSATILRCSALTFLVAKSNAVIAAPNATNFKPKVSMLLLPVNTENKFDTPSKNPATDNANTTPANDLAAATVSLSIILRPIKNGVA